MTDVVEAVEARGSAPHELDCVGAHLARVAIGDLFSNGEVSPEGGVASRELIVKLGFGASGRIDARQLPCVTTRTHSAAAFAGSIKRALPKDPHFGGLDSNGKVVIRPVAGEQIIRESWLYSIIRGTARNASAARCREAWDTAYQYALVMFAGLVPGQEFSVKDALRTLEGLGLAPNSDHRKVLAEYLKLTPAAVVVNEEKAVYRARQGVRELVVEMVTSPRVENLRERVEYVIAGLRGQEGAIVTPDIVAGSLGVSMPSYQRQELTSYLMMSPNLRPISEDSSVFCCA